ncbi:hypothetical protein BC628DRAFT_1173543 [Trametes gibbosa]|nr:hypothetical protein BC628DRAFT_1173543 [Trametes gibbosa]
MAYPFTTDSSRPNPSLPQNALFAQSESDRSVPSASHLHQPLFDFPWCPSCGPVIRAILAQANSYLPNCSSGGPLWTPESSNSLDAFVPVLVHRSHIAVVGSSSVLPPHDRTSLPSGSRACVQAPGAPPSTILESTMPPRRTRGVKVAVRISPSSCGRQLTCFGWFA